MPKGRPFRLPGFRTWVGEITQVTAREAAKEVVKELIVLGPWYSGQFAKNWVVRAGDVRIPAVVPQESKIKTPRVEIPLPVISSLRGTGAKKNIGYSIGNRTEYRNIALDLVEGRIKNPEKASAPQDWYRTYAEGGGLVSTLKKATGIAAQDPKIRGFKGKETDE